VRVGSTCFCVGFWNDCFIIDDLEEKGGGVDGGAEGPNEGGWSIEARSAGGSGDEDSHANGLARVDDVLGAPEVDTDG
jgi:hypothetical protein